MHHNTLHLGGPFLRLLWHGNLPLTFVVLEYESLVVELRQDVGRLLVLNRSCTFLNNLLLKLSNSLSDALLFRFPHIFLKFEVLDFSLRTPALGSSLKHGNATTVDR